MRFVSLRMSNEAVHASPRRAGQGSRAKPVAFSFSVGSAPFRARRSRCFASASPSIGRHDDTADAVRALHEHLAGRREPERDERFLAVQPHDDDTAAARHLAHFRERKDQQPLATTAPRRGRARPSTEPARAALVRLQRHERRPARCRAIMSASEATKPSRRFPPRELLRRVAADRVPTFRARLQVSSDVTGTPSPRPPGCPPADRVRAASGVDDDDAGDVRVSRTPADRRRPSSRIAPDRGRGPAATGSSRSDSVTVIARRERPADRDRRHASISVRRLSPNRAASARSRDRRLGERRRVGEMCFRPLRSTLSDSARPRILIPSRRRAGAADLEDVLGLDVRQPEFRHQVALGRQPGG